MGYTCAMMNFTILIGPVLIAIVMAYIIPPVLFYPKFFILLSWSLYGIGLLCFIIAKLSVIKKGKLITFGSFQMSSLHKKLYKTGYLLMIIAFLFTLALINIRLN